MEAEPNHAAEIISGWPTVPILCLPFTLSIYEPSWNLMRTMLGVHLVRHLIWRWCIIL